jgi:predicted  nucleic acid-binding Zn-ribbon protein
MKRWTILMLLGVTMLLAGCASADHEPVWEEEPGFNDDNSDLPDPDPQPQEPVDQGGDVVQDSDVPALATRKIIYRADLHMRVTDPTAVYNNVLSQIATYTAYVEAADITTDEYELTIRVLSSEFDAFVEAIKTNGELVSYQKTSEDITNTYSTFEARKLALETRHDRILDLISQATDLDTILELEEERYEIEAELNAIGNTLANYDSLVDYSTVTLRITEAVEEIVVLPRTETPNVRIVETTKNSIKVEVYNHSDENVTIQIDLYQNGEFVAEYEEATFADSLIETTFSDLQSNREYTIRVTAVATDHRVSLEEVVRRTTESTFGNRFTTVFSSSLTLLVTLFEYLGLTIAALTPFAVVGAVVFLPIRFLILPRIRRRP